MLKVEVAGDKYWGKKYPKNEDIAVKLIPLDLPRLARKDNEFADLVS
jgi:hypothetical protein